MAGSRKGEHRGGAKKKLDDPAPRPTARHMEVRLPSKKSEEFMRQIAGVVNADPNDPVATMMPKEMMLEAQRYFYSRALMLREQADMLFKAMMQAPDREHEEQLQVQLDATERLARRELLLSADVGMKVAPFYHSKVSSRDAGAEAESPLEALTLLLRDIDDMNRGRPTWQRAPELKLVGSNARSGD